MKIGGVWFWIMDIHNTFGDEALCRKGGMDIYHCFEQFWMLRLDGWHLRSDGNIKCDMIKNFHSSWLAIVCPS